MIRPPSTIGVAIVSKGRPQILAETLASLAEQTWKPERIVLVVPSAQDLPPVLDPAIQTVIGPLGASVQRNEAIKVIPLSVDYVAFFDDDMELRADYLACAVALMDGCPSVIAFSGQMLGNGNITREEARAKLAANRPAHSFRGMFRITGRDHTLHGCNMIVRRSVLEYEQFDEALPLYSYNEDYDLSLRLKAYGRVGRFAGCIGVHLETPSGRVREDLRGYSLVANNYYFLTRKKVHLPVPLAWIRFWVICVTRPLLICLWSFSRGDRSKDFIGRSRGILRAVGDIFAGKCHPGRILEF